MTIERTSSFRLAAILVLLVATTGLATACGGGGTAAGALIGAGVGAAIGSSFDCGYADCDCYDCDPYYYYKAGDGDYDEAW